ncbi:hypothetical protein [Micromonospora maritima]|uniref:Uridine kinase n=1 Tax=Micromonospora maritima TaxID=986711 RepID=A0ABW7ZHQ0_9ACTN
MSRSVPPPAGPRGELLDRLADHLARCRPPHPLRVAVDGPDAAGKTWLADDRARARPEERADVVLDLTDPLAPAVLAWRR